MNLSTCPMCTGEGKIKVEPKKTPLSLVQIVQRLVLLSVFILPIWVYLLCLLVGFSVDATQGTVSVATVIGGIATIISVIALLDK